MNLEMKSFLSAISDAAREGETVCVAGESGETMPSRLTTALAGAALALAVATTGCGAVDAPVEKDVSVVAGASHPALVETRTGASSTYYTRDDAGNVVKAVEKGELGVTWTFSDFDAGVFGRAQSSAGTVVEQTVAEKNEAGLPTVVERSNGFTYRIDYHADGSIERIAVEARGTTMAEASYDDEGYLTGLDGTGYAYDFDAAGRPVSASTDGETCFAYTYDELGRLATFTMLDYDLECFYAYEGNGTEPVSITDSAGGTSTFSYKTYPATPWRGALAKTRDAVDVLNTPTTETIGSIFDNFAGEPRGIV
jgi:YD repeat-containing protein